MDALTTKQYQSPRQRKAKQDNIVRRDGTVPRLPSPAEKSKQVPREVTEEKRI